MSLVGTRPPTVDEWDKYELHHRARLATKPGLTGMWQVSGRSNITDFEEVVKLDKQYISELKKYHTSLEYKYEVTLDLENFFPTINPIIIYHYIVKNLPAHLKKEDMNLMKRLLRKLLFCKLVTQLDEKMLKQYYKAFKSQTNNKETVKKSKDINVCGNIKQCEFARGIAQGLPQSYFLGNIYDDPYKSLKQLVQIKLKLYANKHYEVIDNFCKDFQKMQNEDILKFLLDNENGLFNKMKVVCANTQRTLRMVMNAIYSYLFNVEISDQPILAKNSKKGLTYGELRILSFLRNPLFNIEEFQKREILLDNGQNEHTVDYSIMRVIEIFYSFVKEPVRIDNLIVTHKYICDVWKNGSKHLYFYTLHNQEHAIVLIQNIVKLINTIDFLKISSIDYYILFLACYLHDISMVKIPACDSFLLDTDKADELAKTLLDSYNEEFNKANLTKNVQGNDIDILSVKKYMLDIQLQ